MNEPFSLPFTLEILPLLLRGAGVTFLATAGGFVAALVVGAILFATTLKPLRVVALPSRGIMEVLRSTPLLIQVYILFFLLPNAGVTLSPIVTGLIALGLYHGAYVAEAYRSAMSHIPQTQWDTLEALRFPRRAAFRHVVFPQIVSPLVPALGNTFITMLKDTPILAAVTVPELMFEANEVGSQTFRYIEPITLAALSYLLMSLIAASFVFLIESRLRRRFQ